MKHTAKNQLLVALVCLMASACEPTQRVSEVDAAESAVMAQHDTLMQRTFGLYKLRQQLSTPAMKADPRAPAAVHGLLAADAAMNTWMHQYHAPDSTAPEPQRLAYFRAQRQQLDAVQKQMQGTIDSATALLKGSRK